MNPAEFNDLYLQNLLDTLAFENKDIFLMGDFNINILQYDNNKDSQEFLDKMHSNFLMPYISSPSRVTPRSQTPIDSIFSNKIEEESFSANITTTVSDHHAQFLLLENNNLPEGQKERKQIRDYKKSDKKNFETDLKSTNCIQILKLNLGNTNNSFEIFFETFNKTLDKHTPLRKLSIQEDKLRKKPWITPDILTSIENKNKLYRKYIRAKDPSRKTILHNEFK